MASLSILETALYASDLEAVERFYTEVLGLTLDSRVSGRHAFFRCGDSMLLVFDPDSTSATVGEVPTHGARGPGHVAFAVGDDDFDSWSTRLAEHDVEIEASIGWPAGGRSIYFRDPAGNSVELATPGIWGIGPRWTRRAPRGRIRSAGRAVPTSTATTRQHQAIFFPPDAADRGPHGRRSW